MTDQPQPADWVGWRQFLKLAEQLMAASSVVAFVGDRPPSDDITLMVLRRRVTWYEIFALGCTGVSLARE